MRWHNKLYLSPALQKKENDARKELEQGQGRRGLWVICISANGKDMLDIRRAASFLAHGQSCEIVGLADSKDEALTLVQKMLSDSMQSGSGADLRLFFEGAGQFAEGGTHP